LYKDHVPVIRDAMRADLDVFRRGCMFAVCSIRQPTINVPDQLGILFDNEEGENPLFGHKFGAFDYIMSPKGAALWRELTTLHYTARGAKAGCEFAIGLLLDVPGLGIVKAAFIAQLMGFDVACLDARNVTREGRNPRAYRTDGKTARQLAPKVRAYVAETFGKAEFYWNAWCQDVAAAYGRTPEEISALHLAIVPANYVPF
jgi:hypothetical protein